MEEIKKCPICGTEPTVGEQSFMKPTRSNDFSEYYMSIEQLLARYQTVYYVKCPNCTKYSYDTESLDNAIDKWNNGI